MYLHSRLNTGEPFYIGKGRGNRAYTTNSRSDHWKNIVAKDGGHHVNVFVDGVDEELAFLVEMEAIRKWRKAGCRLVNKTDGGDGISGYRFPNGGHNKGKPCAEETKARISATLKAKGCLPPVGWNKGKKTPPGVIEKMRPAMLAAWAKAKANGERQTSPETRAKQRAAKLGKKQSAEQRKAASERMKADPKVQERRFKTTRLGCKHTMEARAKMSAGMRGRIASNRRPVRCVDTGELFESATEAAKRFGRNGHSLIAACCRGASRSAYGHRFEYENG